MTLQDAFLQVLPINTNNENKNNTLLINDDHIYANIAAELLKNMDESVDPCDDFYSFACGRFERDTIIPDDQSSVTTFSLLNDEVTEQLRAMIEKPITEDEAEPFKLVKRLYQSCLNRSTSPFFLY